MATKPLTTEAIALTEKKMDMTLDDIIKMSKKNPSKTKRPPRPPIKNQGFRNISAPQGNNRPQRFLDSRSSIRQGALAKRRSNFHGNQFPITTEMARKAAVMPVRNRAVNQNGPRVAATAVQRRGGIIGSPSVKDNVFSKQRPQTLDALFANMKEQRMRSMYQKVNRGNGAQISQRVNGPRLQQRRQQQQQQQGRGGGARGGHRRQFSNFAK